MTTPKVTEEIVSISPHTLADVIPAHTFWTNNGNLVGFDDVDSFRYRENDGIRLLANYFKRISLYELTIAMADVYGSQLIKDNEEIRTNLLHAAHGLINEPDIHKHYDTIFSTAYHLQKTKLLSTNGRTGENDYFSKLTDAVKRCLPESDTNYLRLNVGGTNVKFLVIPGGENPTIDLNYPEFPEFKNSFGRLFRPVNGYIHISNPSQTPNTLAVKNQIPGLLDINEIFIGDSKTPVLDYFRATLGSLKTIEDHDPLINN
jgi:hypothetical protein